MAKCLGKTAKAAAEVGEDPQLDLRVVGGEQDATGRRDERGSNPTTLFGADRDVLQIGVGGREPAGGGGGL